ncbi:hypothetical protein SAMN04488069_11739 [Hymenobacter psychrophilus]|uniref:Uncharacterized protein n=1 Tax=Hymenobacter psychrophilus TaxID=651662 RepID=A0A1H3NJK1_9BACT|nr:hypothetical protein SAMN04488069_11739 [Hymenobacter psychrophilus]
MAVYRLLAYLLCSLLLLQTLEQELLVVNYELNQARITARYCVNKARPQLKCNGKCHLAKQLRSAADEDEKVPAGSIRLKFDLVPAPAHLTLTAPRYWPAAPGRYAAPAALRYADAPARGVFRPPLV